MNIIGAGLAGLITSCMLPKATILERARAPELGGAHKALLRFRSDVVSSVTGIPFKRVLVQKGLWGTRGPMLPSIYAFNQYSDKVVGRISARSVSLSLEPQHRYVAPPDFYERLLERMQGRIHWGEVFAPAQGAKLGPTISTAPLPIAASTLLDSDAYTMDVTFNWAPIDVVRYRVADCDVYQTLYFPELWTSTYRASITGDLLIAESMQSNTTRQPLNEDSLAEAFGLGSDRLTKLDGTSQRYGKIAPIDDKVRRELIHQMTLQRGVYSVGRFATWRNILLDDVVNDVRVVSGLIEQGDAYAARKKSLPAL